MTTAIALTIAGSDPSGGAGIQADLKTFSALGVYGASAITALTVQNTRGVTAVEIVPPQLIAAQIDAVCGDLTVGAVKIGMLGNAAAIEAVADALDRHAQKNVVLDPVMMSGTGERLLAQDALDVLRRVLIPRALLLTPNLAEAAALLDAPPARSESDMRAQAARLLGLGARAVLVKGGHAGGAESIDFLIDGAVELRLAAARIAARNLHARDRHRPRPAAPFSRVVVRGEAGISSGSAPPFGAARPGPRSPMSPRRPPSRTAAASCPGRRRAACRWRSRRPGPSP